MFRRGFRTVREENGSNCRHNNDIKWRAHCVSVQCARGARGARGARRAGGGKSNVIKNLVEITAAIVKR